jgi:DNA-directed RNA polymerase specialized sigma24 family protein
MVPDDDRDRLIPSRVEATSTAPTDPWTALLAKFKAGDKRAFETLIGGVKRDVEAFRSRKRFNPADVDDIVGETLGKVWAERARFEGDIEGFRAWVRNLLSLEARTLTQRRSREKARAASEEAFDALGVTADALEGLERDARWTFLTMTIPALPASQRLIVLLRLADHEWDETAWICGTEEGRPVTPAAVRERYRLAVAKLREAYARRG